MYSTLCHVQADTSQLSTSLKAQKSDVGKEYYGITFDVVLSLGLTELKAHIVWEEGVRYLACYCFAFLHFIVFDQGIVKRYVTSPCIECITDYIS